MERPYQFIDVERQDPVFCVRFRPRSLNDLELEELGAEVARVVDEEGCRKLVLCLGPEDPKCMVSLFLAKLVSLHKRLENDGGVLALAQLSPFSRTIVRAAGLDRFFHFYPDAMAARAALSEPVV